MLDLRRRHRKRLRKGRSQTSADSPTATEEFVGRQSRNTKLLRDMAKLRFLVRYHICE